MRITEAARVHIEDQMRDMRILVDEAQQKLPAKLNEFVLADLRAHRPMIEGATDIETVVRHLNNLIDTFEFFQSAVVDAVIALLKNLIEDLELQPA